MKKQFLKTSKRKRVLVALGYNDPQLLQGIWKYCQKSGWILETSMMNYGVIPEFWEGDGILTILYPNRPQLVDFVKSRRVKTVNMTADIPYGAHVLLDNHRCGEMAADHLLRRGFKRLAFLQFSNASDIVDRLAGFQKSAKKAGAEFLLLNASKIKESRKRTHLKWLSEQLTQLPRPIGVLAQSDTRANLLINACESIGIKIPEEIAVVGIDNNEIVCKSAPVPITSVDSNRGRLAYEAAALLDRLMNHEAPPVGPIIIPPKEIVVRQSSNILAIDHPEVAAALRFIWEHFTESITVENVNHQSRMSRCGIYRAFEKYVGRSIGDEINRKRFEKAKILLSSSDLKHYEIASQCGFSSGEHFSRAFMREFGVAPSRYNP